MLRVAVRLLGLASVVWLVAGQSGWAGTIRHDRDDLLYTDLAALAEYDPVGIVRNNGETGLFSGTLVKPQWVLTAAHSVTNPAPTSSTFDVGGIQYTADQWIAHPLWTGVLGRGVDLALIHLTTPVSGITPATLYTGSTEFDQAATIVGFGVTGTGLTGSIPDSNGTKRAGENIIDALGSAIGASDNYSLTDFDSPFANANSFGDEFPLDLEYKTAVGDSGGGVFIDDGGTKKLAGVPSFSAYADDIPNSSYGEIDGFVRVSLFTGWISEQTSPIPNWNVDANGNWTQESNWSGAVPNAAGARAILGSVLTAPHTVTVDSPISVGQLTFDNANTYTIDGASALTLDVAAGEAQINVTTGNHVVNATLTLADNTTVTVSPETSNLSLTGQINAASLRLSKAGGGTLTINQIRAGTLAVDAGTVSLAPGAAGASVIGTLSIAGPANAPTAKLDLNNGAAVVDYTGTNSPIGPLRQRILAGRGAVGLGATWNGMGITSAAAATANATEAESRSIGFAENATMPLGSLTTFHGQAVDDTAILIAYTRTGDANLDGLVNDDDVTIVGATYAPGVAQPSWAMGDFDFNGFVDDDDVTLLGVLYDPSAPPLTSAPFAIAGSTSAAASTAAPALASGGSSAIELAAVPEPSTLALASIVGALLLLRRRAHHAVRYTERA
jgi:hypothetical protein